MASYYNEIDPFAAAWLRELIRAGHIAYGDVDERSIEDVKPVDLHGYTQCHFFAGIGVWSYALRRAGWPDSRPVWTGSCPCQPFSAAGKGGGFADERHLWPAFYHLICECRPVAIFGEQVASKDGLAWLDLVQADLEDANYTSGAVDICAAGVGAPHIRQRLFWVADSESKRREQLPHITTARIQREAIQSSGKIDGLGNICATSVWMDDDDDTRLEGLGRGHQAASGRHATAGSVAEAGESGGMADTTEQGYGGAGGSCIEGLRDATERHGSDGRPGPTNGHWRDADWLYCRDDKWRPVESGTFPLVNGASARVGRLRGYGNAIVAPVAQAFIEAYMTELQNG